LRDFLGRIERQYGKARRLWLMDRGIPTEEVLEEMKRSDPPTAYLVGTPKSRLNKLEADLANRPWQQAREGVEVKLLTQEHETYVPGQQGQVIRHPPGIAIRSGCRAHFSEVSLPILRFLVAGLLCALAPVAQAQADRGFVVEPLPHANAQTRPS
jgi:hypothetical protein